jgi:hypothetical protein
MGPTGGIMRILLILIVLSVCVSRPAWAGVLDRRGHEVNLGFQYYNKKDFGSTLDFSGTWLLILGEGYIEVGPQVEYARIDPKGEGSVDALMAGPRFEMNFTPEEPLTGYLSFTPFFTGGDLGKNTNGGISGGIGVKAFAGDSASVNTLIGGQKIFADGNFEDQDSFFISVSLSLYLGQPIPLK